MQREQPVELPETDPGLPAGAVEGDPALPDPNADTIGDSDAKPFVIDLDSYSDEGLRVAIFGSSGAGKGYLLGCFVEELIDAGVPVVMLDAEQELWVFKAAGALVVGGNHADAPFVEDPAAIDAVIRWAIDNRAPVVFDVGVLAEADEVEASRLGELVMRRLLAVTDQTRTEVAFACTEAAIFAPEIAERGQRRPTAMRQIFVRGRKRGIIPIIDTQRMADIQKGLISQANMTFVGKINKSVDYQPLRQDVGGRPFEDFRTLRVGEFYTQPGGTLVHSRERRIQHGGGRAEVTVEATHRASVEDVIRALQEAADRKAPPPAALSHTAAILSARGGGKTEHLIEEAVASRTAALGAQIASLEQAVTEARAEEARLADQLATVEERNRVIGQAAAGAMRLQAALRDLLDDGSPLTLEIERVRGEIRTMIAEEIAQRGGGGVTVQPVEALRLQFMEDAAGRLMQRIAALDEEQRRVLLFLLAHAEGVTINAISVGLTGNDSGAARATVTRALEPLISMGLVRIGGSGRSKRYPALDAWVASELRPHEATDGEWQAVRDRALSLLQGR